MKRKSGAHVVDESGRELGPAERPPRVRHPELERRVPGVVHLQHGVRQSTTGCVFVKDNKMCASVQGEPHRLKSELRTTRFDANM